MEIVLCILWRIYWYDFQVTATEILDYLIEFAWNCGLSLLKVAYYSFDGV